MKRGTLLSSFRFAWQGIWHATLRERNLKIHWLIALIVCLAGTYLHISANEWLACIIFFALVIGSELINTAIETLADRVTTEHDEAIGFLKDASAGAVLVSAFFAAVGGCIIFIPKLLTLFK